MRVAVVGASGFIGRACVEALSELSTVTPVRAPRLRARTSSVRHLERQLLQADVERFAESALAGVDVVVNAGGAITRYRSYLVDRVLFHGGDGDDWFANETALPSTAYGEAGNDTLLGGSVRDRLFGGLGNDLLEGRDGRDVLWGGVGDDLIWGGPGNDELHGEEGDDDLRGNEGDDAIWGNSGSDKLHGGQGNDTLYGNRGNDTLRSGRGKDLLDGGQGKNTIINRD